MRDMTFKTRIFLCFLAVILVTMVLPGMYVRRDIKQEGIGESIRSAEREAVLISMVLGTGKTLDELNPVLVQLAKTLDIRISYIDMYGKVLADSDSGQYSIKELDNHADRLEVISALQGGTGVSIRHSNTLKTDLVYVAIPFVAVGGLPAGLIRVAVPLARVESRITEAETQWFSIFAVGTVLALLLAFALSARLERSLKAMIRVVEGIAASPGLAEGLAEGRVEGRVEGLTESGAANVSARVAENRADWVHVQTNCPGQTDRLLNRRRLHILPGREFRRLARAVNDMADRIEDDLRTIAEQKAQLETILAVMDEGVLVIGAQGRIRLVNPALVRLFPQTAKAVGRLPVEVLPVAELQQALDELLATRSSDPKGRQVSTLEVETSQDHVFSVHLIRPRTALNGVLAVAVFHDVSEMARLVRIRREFVANVSHELRTPLTAITGYAETLRDTPPEDVATCVRFAEIILRHARLMGSMVEDLMKLSRIESGAIPLNPVPLRASAVLADVAAVCQALLASRGLSFTAEVDESLMILADGHFIAQVFRNLLENACRYAPQGTTVTLEGHSRPCVRPVVGKLPNDEQPSEGQTAFEAVFTIRDLGPGIPASALDRVFERFYRVEKHRGGSASTGLGLAICKHIVERHGGRIWAEAGPGGVFSFTVPLVINGTLL